MARRRPHKGRAALAALLDRIRRLRENHGRRPRRPPARGTTRSDGRARRAYLLAQEEGWNTALQAVPPGHARSCRSGHRHRHPPIGAHAAERLGYPTQKPLALLERIIEVSSNEGDVVLDPFCGCGTAVDAAQKLRRRWIGVDVTFLAIDLIRKRMRNTHGDAVEATYEVHGIPADLGGAKALFAENPFDFERWAVSLIDAQPNEKQVGDKGIDGRVRFYSDKKLKKAACGFVIPDWQYRADFFTSPQFSVSEIDRDVDERIFREDELPLIDQVDDGVRKPAADLKRVANAIRRERESGVD